MSHNAYYREPQFSFSMPRLTWAVQRLILITSGIFAVQLLLHIPFGGRPGEVPGGWVVFNYLAFSISNVLTGFLHTPLTYMFLHAGLLHLFMNMLWLFFFGPEVERALGSRGFVRFYLTCGVVGVLANFLTFALYGVGANVVGASGATMGVLVAFAMVDPDRQFYLFPLPVPINARALVMIVVFINIISALGESNVSVETHFCGMAVGFLYMKALPLLTQWRAQRRWRPQAKKAKKRREEEQARDRDPRFDKVGKAVDDIFKSKDSDDWPGR